jgi:hypothetical protein
MEGASEPLKLLLGEKAPTGSGLYAKLPTQPRVFTIGGWLESTFDKKPFDLRDRDVLHVKRDSIRSLDVAGPEGSYALVRDDRGEWAFTEPLATRAGRWSVDSLLGVLENLRMDSVAAEEAKDLKPFGLDKPARRVVMGLADGGSRTLEIGKEAGEKKYHARDPSSRLVAVIPGAIVEDLAKGMAERRAKRLLDVATYDVVGFDVEAGAAKTVYGRTSVKEKEGVESFKWKRTAPDAKDLETSAVQDALFKIGGTEVQEFLDAPGPPASYGLDAPALKVTVRHDGGKPTMWFEVAKKDGGAWARRDGDAAVLKLDPAKADELIQAFQKL